MPLFPEALFIFFSFCFFSSCLYCIISIVHYSCSQILLPSVQHICWLKKQNKTSYFSFLIHKVYLITGRVEVPSFFFELITAACNCQLGLHGYHLGWEGKERLLLLLLLSPLTQWRAFSLLISSEESSTLDAPLLIPSCKYCHFQVRVELQDPHMVSIDAERRRPLPKSRDESPSAILGLLGHHRWFVCV